MDVDFSGVASVLASPSRSAMVGALLDGRALTASELARVAGVSAPTASGHIAELESGGLATVVKQGRHRYVRLAGPEVAAALEALAHICPQTTVTSLRTSREARDLAYARTCYDHLAGRVGVAVYDGMVEGGWLRGETDGLVLTPTGRDSVGGLGVDVEALLAARRSFARPCLDWTERRPHLAGGLGAALTSAFLDRDWLRRTERRRGLRLTDTGRDGLDELLDVELPTASDHVVHRRTRPGAA